MENTTDKYSHATENANAWLKNIQEMVIAWNNAASEHDKDEARQTILESPLSVLVRSAWYDPCTVTQLHELAPTEFEILLSTGGPALRIRGSLDNDLQPENPALEYQDWSIPWTEYFTGSLMNDYVKQFCSFFYYGEA